MDEALRALDRTLDETSEDVLPVRSGPAPADQTPHAPATELVSEGCGVIDQQQPWEFCGECSIETVRSRIEAERVCPECKRLYECPVETDLSSLGEDRKKSRAPRLTIVGDNRGKFQRELDKAAFIDTDESRILEVYEELCNFARRYGEVTGRVFSKRILDEVANTYVKGVTPLGGVIRSLHKRAALGFLVYVICVQAKEACSRQEASALMQLPNGLARGESLIRTIGACSELLELLDRDQDVAWVSTGFSRLGFRYRPHILQECGFPTGEQPTTFQESDRELIAMLHEAAVRLLKHGISKRVGIACISQTRGTGALYAVLRRATLAGKIPGHWKLTDHPAVKARGSLDWVADLCGIRPQTVKGYLASLHKFHRIFVPIYREFGLDASRREIL